ncbi:MAG: nitroreductase family protein, partial [Candidatus Acidiferrum sp.]
MENPARTDHPIHTLISHRWSPRAFAAQPVPADVLRSLFEAARWAPSSSNEQPWVYLVATQDNAEEFAKMTSVLVEFNAGWAKHASVLALAVCRLDFEKNKTPNRNAQYDTGAATALLCVEATARGLFVHQMAGFDPDKAREVFGIPAGWEAIAAVAVGYPGDPNTLPPVLKD